MINPWDLQKDDNRNADILQTFIIFCEDMVSEPIYFKYFETSQIKINTIGGQKSKTENVFKAIKHGIEENYISYLGSETKISLDGIQIWCVFDRDKEDDQDKLEIGNICFTESIATANRNGIKVAWSNDSFELWVLLHFMEIDIEKGDEYKHRNYYYDQLTEYFKNCNAQIPDLTKALSHSSFNYKRDLKSENNFRNIVRKLMIGKTIEAIERSNRLLEFHKCSSKPEHEQVPCTLVHLLVQDLLKYGNKKLQ